MRAWLPETRVAGPERATERDIEGMNRVFAEAFTDRYRRDGLVGVRVPQLNPLVWRYALLGAGEGAMVWRDERDEIAAFNVAHRSGTEGWMGPLAVRPDRQGTGVGKTVVRTAADWLIDRGVVTLGLETMPRTPENIGFLVMAVLGYAWRRKLIEIRDPAVLFTAACALMPFIVFNQQIITGQSLQPIHYKVFIANYVALVSVVEVKGEKSIGRVVLDAGCPEIIIQR